MSRGTCQRAAAATAAGTAQSWPNLLTLLFSAFSPLSLFPSFHSVCHSINSNSSLFFFVSPAPISGRVLLRVRMLYYLRQEVIGDHADRILEVSDSRLVSLIPFHQILPAVSSLHHLLLLPLSDNTPTQMCMHL